MNEFDLRKFLYNNPLLESEKKLKAKKKRARKARRQARRYRHER